eukprot:7376444-Prymnesium_polylepis.1
MSWKSNIKMLVHVADAPAHGSEYHDGLGDNHDGPQTPDPADMMRQLGQMKVAYYFFKINSSTDKMIGKLKEAHKNSRREFKCRQLRSRRGPQAADVVELARLAFEERVLVEQRYLPFVLVEERLVEERLEVLALVGDPGLVVRHPALLRKVLVGGTGELVPSVRPCEVVTHAACTLSEPPAEPDRCVRTISMCAGNLQDRPVRDGALG